MNKRIVLWSILIVLILISLPGFFQRWEAEVDNDTYEIAIPYQEIFNLTTKNTITIEEAMDELAEAGLNTIGIEPLSLDSLQDQEIIMIYSQWELEDRLQFTHPASEYKQEENGFYITAPEDPYYVDIIKENFETITLTINKQDLYFISTETDKEKREDQIDRYTTLGYDQEVIALADEYGLSYILRIENDTDDVNNNQTINSLIKLQSDPNLSTLLFTGIEVIGYPEESTIQSYATELQNAGFHFNVIEFSDQKGMRSLARTTNYHTVRLHSLDLTDRTGLNVDRTIRAVKERNIRTVYAHLMGGNPIDSLDNATEYLTAVAQEMPAHYKQDKPVPINSIELSVLNQITILIAGILFTYLASGILRSRFISISAISFMALLIIGYFILHKLIFLQAFALVITIITPIYAVVSTAKDGKTSIMNITLRYLAAIGITGIGIAILVGTLNGNGFISGFELFRGVKLVYIIPILFMALSVIWNKYFKISNAGVLITALRQPVKYWHIVIIAFISLITYYYITRTGNAGSVSEMELIIRQKLEQILYVRPRTKEFLIGLPIFMVALYTMGINKIWGKILLIPGIIGFLSMINTFSHFHIPLNVSVLRTSYSIVLGYIIGLIFIFIFIVCYRVINNIFKKRWN